VQEPWSPDGKRIAVSYLDRLWSMTPGAKGATRPQNPEPMMIEREPAWSSMATASLTPPIR
jgi:hypothetical protein